MPIYVFVSFMQKNGPFIITCVLLFRPTNQKQWFGLITMQSCITHWLNKTELFAALTKIQNTYDAKRTIKQCFCFWTDAFIRSMQPKI